MLLLHLQYLPVPKWWIQKSDWREHSCPDGYKYYYNCITRESRWGEPVEFTLFHLQQLQKQQKLHSSNQQPSLSPVCFAEELDRVQIQSETSPAIDPSCV